ncbi:MAG: hypothetical protein ISR48_09600 [Alphaproteobacteria bacterium]|nr:hypothetical protein [Alphaproteobacteria bacterium]
MTNEEQPALLESIISQMLNPVKDVPLDLIIHVLSGKEVIPIDLSLAEDQSLLKGLEGVINLCSNHIQADPIVRPRANEVGNDVEAYVKRALMDTGYRVEPPRSVSGKTKSTGYPDILFFDDKDRPTYLECKTFSADKIDSTMRSFYLSPSDEFKVSLEARHLVLSFEMESSPIDGSNNSEYRPTSYKLLDVHSLLCDVKYEFNSNNKRLYGQSLTLQEGRLA